VVASPHLPTILTPTEFSTGSHKSAVATPLLPKITLLYDTYFHVLHLFEDVASPEEVAALLAFVVTITDWEERTGLPGTRRRNFGVAMDPADNYRPRATCTLPPVLAALGARLLGFCKAQPWPAACSDIGATPPFVQAYVQRYVPGETLGFHFDERPTYAELIVGLSVCGEGRLLLGHTNGSKEVTPRALQQPNVRAVALPPGSLYCLTGMSRYDLRHAVVQDGAAERISITFRALK